MRKRGEDEEVAVSGGGKLLGPLLLAVAALVVCVYSVLFLVLVFRGPFEAWRHRRGFDPAAWRGQDAFDHSTPWPPRLCMVDDLLASGRLLGMTEDQVVRLLGTPASKDFPFDASACDMRYYLGPERGFMRIDSEWLFIKLDSGGRVARQWLYRD
jgi:hypothetical protein